MTKRTFIRSLAAFAVLPSLPIPKPAPKEMVFDPKAYYGEWKWVYCGAPKSERDDVFSRYYNQ